MKKAAVILFSILCLLPAMPRDTEAATYNVNSYIKLYTQNSPSLAQAWYRLEQARLTFRNKFMDLFLPSANYSAGTEIYSKQKQQLRFDNEYNGTFSINYNLFNSFKDISAFQQQKNTLEMAQIAYDSALQDTILEAIRQFYNLKLQESLLSVTRNDLKQKEEQYNMTKALYRAGMKSYSTLLQSENTFKKAELNLKQRQSSYDSLKMAFNIAVNAGPMDDVSLDYELPPLPPLFTTSYEDDLKTAINNREDFQRQILTLRNQKIENSLTRRSNIPSVQADFSFSNTNRDYFGANSGYTDYSLGVNLRVPINFLFLNNINRIKISELALRGDYMGFETLLRSVKQKVFETRNQLKLELEGVNLSANNLKIAKERLAITLNQYNSGETSLLELNDAQEEFFSTQVNDVNYRYQYQLSQYSYKRTLGLPIYDVSGLTLDFDSYSDRMIKKTDRNFLDRKK